MVIVILYQAYRVMVIGTEKYYGNDGNGNVIVIKYK